MSAELNVIVVLPRSPKVLGHGNEQKAAYAFLHITNMKEYRFTISECSPVHATVQYRNAELSVDLTEEIDFAEPFETLACLLRLKHINTGILLHLQDALGAEQRKSKLPASNAHYQYAIGLVSKTAHGVYDNFLL